MSPSDRIVSETAAGVNVQSGISASFPAAHAERIAGLEPKIQRTAAYWAARTGIEKDELVSEMYLALVEMSCTDPEFLDHTDGWYTTGAMWTVLSRHRREVRDHLRSAYSLDEGSNDERAEAVLSGPDGDCVESVHEALENLPEVLQTVAHALLEGIRKGDEGVLKGRGTVNVCALAQRLGMPERTVNHHVHKLRGHLGHLVAA